MHVPNLRRWLTACCDELSSQHKGHKDHKCDDAPRIGHRARAGSVARDGAFEPAPRGKSAIKRAAIDPGS
jgi:hypothetical protein